MYVSINLSMHIYIYLSIISSGTRKSRGLERPKMPQKKVRLKKKWGRPPPRPPDTASDRLHAHRRSFLFCSLLLVFTQLSRVLVLTNPVSSTTNHSRHNRHESLLHRGSGSGSAGGPKRGGFRVSAGRHCLFKRMCLSCP
jgi:hypothetical protein